MLDMTTLDMTRADKEMPTVQLDMKRLMVMATMRTASARSIG